MPDDVKGLVRDILIDLFDRKFGVERYYEDQKVKEIEQYIQYHLDRFEGTQDELVEKARQHAEDTLYRLDQMVLSNLVRLMQNRLGMTGHELLRMLVSELPPGAAETILRAKIEDESSIPDPDQMKVPPEYQDYIDEVLEVIDRSRMRVLQEPDLRVFQEAIVLGYKDMEISLTKPQLGNIKAVKSLGRYIQDTYQAANELVESRRHSGDIFYDSISRRVDRVCKSCAGKRLIFSAIADYLRDNGIRVHS